MTIIFTVEAKVMDGVMISSPSPIPKARRIRCMPAVAEVTETAWDAPVNSQNLSSNALHIGPVVIHPDFRQSTTLSISLSPMEGLDSGKKSCLTFISNQSLILDMHEAIIFIIPQNTQKGRLFFQLFYIFVFRHAIDILLFMVKAKKLIR